MFIFGFYHMLLIEIYNWLSRWKKSMQLIFIKRKVATFLPQNSCVVDSFFFLFLLDFVLWFFRNVARKKSGHTKRLHFWNVYAKFSIIFSFMLRRINYKIHLSADTFIVSILNVSPNNVFKFQFHKHRRRRFCVQLKMDFN